MVDIDDIDDVLNGLLLFKPLKDAFEQRKVSFIYRESTGQLHLKVFDKSLLVQRLFDKLDEEQQELLLQSE